ncbi:hypothetical protein SAMN05444487_103141 [Marininema mesophilum]|uniref:Uncharacterized protein n=1 Tax=Marininema mesophilum TaxID=1048340 RepID=A0A1H2TJQ7_9BACL|nr:hypothetical protein [Marininema mesophilum]SDW43459.1 hypothetical protein SAMN05444487_103141 [Marininema mesophilum]
MAFYDTGPIQNVNTDGSLIATSLLVRVENTGSGYPNAHVQVYRIPGGNSGGFSQQIIFAENVFSLQPSGNKSVFTLPLSLNPSMPIFGVRVTTSPDPGAGEDVVATVFTKDSMGNVVASQRALPGE